MTRTGRPAQSGSAALRRSPPMRTHDRQPSSQLRLQHLAAHVQRLGPRATFEAFAEIARTSERAEARVASVLSRFQRLTPELLHATGGDRFPPRLCEVPR